MWPPSYAWFHGQDAQAAHPASAIFKFDSHCCAVSNQLLIELRSSIQASTSSNSFSATRRISTSF